MKIPKLIKFKLQCIRLSHTARSIQKIISEYFGLDVEQRSFKKYLKTEFSLQIPSPEKNSGIVLIESLQISSNNVALSRFLECYSEIYDIELKAYRMIRIKKLTQFKARLRHQFSILRQMGAKKLLICGAFGTRELQNRNVKKNSKISSLEELEDFQIDGILIGDLIYDLYLTRERLPTIDLTSPRFWDVFNECVEYFNFWVDYFKNNNVKAICISHCVYHYAIPARIAVNHRIDVFQIQSESIHRLQSGNLHAFLSSENLQKEIEDTSSEGLKRGLSTAKSKLNQRFSGHYVEELELSTGIAFNRQHRDSRIDKKATSKLRILVATHDFFDAVHFFGKGFYPDFHRWLRALSDISHDVDFDWLLKIHPNARGGMSELVRQIATQSKNWQVLPLDISHHELFDSGIDLVLTVHGTIATEYPYFGIPVLNASINNPHASFNFSVTPGSRDEYEFILGNLEKQSDELSIKNVSHYQSEIECYFFGRHVLSLKSWIYYDYNAYLQDLGGWNGSMSTSVYRYFMSGKNQIPVTEQLLALRNFILSGDLRLARRHFPINSKINIYQD